MSNKYTLNYPLVLMLSLAISFNGSTNPFGEITGFVSNKGQNNNTTAFNDFLTPNYYLLDQDDIFIDEVDQFLNSVRQQQFHHPFENKKGKITTTTTTTKGDFAAVKRTRFVTLHHTATDLYLQKAQTSVNIYAAHDGYISTNKNSGKYRHSLSITKDIENNDGVIIGKLVTIYAHIDLDLDESRQIWLDEQYVNKGDLISENLYAKTSGGPHLHFEIRYYRLNDDGSETFYGKGGAARNSGLTQPSAGDFKFGAWNPKVGYGFGDPKSHGLFF